MKALYVTDLHGDIDKYDKILQIAIDNNIKCIINGGDMLPKGADTYREEAEIQHDFITEYLNNYFSRLNDSEIKYICMLGNDDFLMYDSLFDNVCSNFSNVFNIANRKVIVAGYEFIGMNNVLDHPFGRKDRVVIEDDFSFEPQRATPHYFTEDVGWIEIPDWENYASKHLNKMREILNNLPTSNDYSKTIYIMHMPPSGIGLGDTKYNIQTGSKEISGFIERKKPMLTLHGHIHESPDYGDKIWSAKINDTDCIQPGQTRLDNEDFVYVLLDLDSKKYTRRVEPVKKYIR